MIATLDRSDTISRPWGRLAYRRRSGHGTPLLLLHPLALAARMWDVAMPEIGPHRDVIAIDLRGHGDSEWDGAPFSIAEMADDIVELLRSLAIERCDLAGMSMGGGVAMIAAATHPRRVRNLALLDTTAWYGAEAKATWEERAHNAEQKPRIDLLAFQTQRWFTESFREHSPEDVKFAVDIFLATRPAAHAQACRALGAFDARSVLSRITARTLVITGEEDYATPPAMGEALAAGIPNATFTLWPGVRHFSVFESDGLRKRLAAHLDA
jgi:3-oxoadipate enol-lactonase